MTTTVLQNQQVFPEHIKIGPITYTIRFVNDLRDGDQKLNGWIRYNSAEVLLDGELSGQKALSTIWHEAIHGILEQRGHNELNSSLDDGLITALTYGSIQLIRDNPWLATWWIETEARE